MSYHTLKLQCAPHTWLKLILIPQHIIVHTRHAAHSSGCLWASQERGVPLHGARCKHLHHVQTKYQAVCVKNILYLDLPVCVSVQSGGILFLF
jgi:hypothetical protein